MAEDASGANSPQDGSYSDDDFGSEAGEETHEEHHAEAAHRGASEQPPVPNGAPDSASGATDAEVSATELPDAEDEAAEQYDAEFEEEEDAVAISAASLPAVEPPSTSQHPSVAAAGVEVGEELLTVTAVDSASRHPEPESAVESEASDSQEEDEEGEKEGLEGKLVPSLPLLNDKKTKGDSVSDSAARRRSSLPSMSARGNLTEEPSLPHDVRRSGSLRHVSSAPPSSKWQDTMPRDLSPEMLTRPGRSALQLSIVKERLSVVLPEADADSLEEREDAETSPDWTIQAPGKVRERSASFQGTEREMEPVPVRRAYSERYSSVLPRVDEVHADEVAMNVDNDISPDSGDLEDEDDYSDDDEEEDDGSDTGRASQHSSTRGVLPTTSDGCAETDVPAASSGISAGAAGTATPGENAVTTEATVVNELPTESVKVENSEESGVSGKGYLDDLEGAFDDEHDEFLEGMEATAHKGVEYTSDFDIEDFAEENKGETEALLQEAHTLLKSNRDLTENADTAINQKVAPEVPETPGVLETPVSSEASTDVVVQSEKEVDSEAQAHEVESSLQYEDEFADDDGGSSNQDSELHHYAGSDFDEDDQEGVKGEDGKLSGMVSLSIVVTSTEEGSLSSDNPGVEVASGSQAEPAKPVTSLKDTPEGQHSINTGIPNAPVVQEENLESAAAGEPRASKDLKMANNPVDQQPPVVSASPQKPASSMPSRRVVKTQQAQARRTDKQAVSRVSEQPRPPSRPSHRSRPLKDAPDSSDSFSLKPSRPAPNRPKPPPVSSNSASRERPHGLREKAVKEVASPTSALPTKTTFTSQPHSHEQQSLIDKSMVHSASATDTEPTEMKKSPRARAQVSSPRSSAKPRPDICLPEDYYPVLPRKEPVPKQKRVAKAPGTTANDHKRRSLMPVKTPANLRFDLPKDKLKRDWLFLNMFRHGEDVNKYEPFVPPAIFAEPSSARGVSKRPLSVRQAYGDPHASGAPAPGRKLVPQPRPGMLDRERNWVATKPHDSQIPAYDSILDKYCTTVTSPVIQRRIYQTRYTDLSPQLAFVLEKRVEKHYKQGLHNAFGGVSASYKTEVVPTLDDGRPSSPRSPRSYAASRPLQ